MTYPHYLYLLDQLQPDVSLYYNIDDYTLYWPPARRADSRRLRCKLVCGPRRPSASPGSVPTSFARPSPKRPRRSIIFPTALRRSFLAEHPAYRPAVPPADIAHLPRPLLGYVGSIEDRVDWRLMER